MARSVRVINCRDFVSAKSTGTLNLEEGEELLREVVGASAPLEEFDILVDTREAASQLSATDLWILADRLVRHPRTFAGKTAILCPAERFDHARFFALCAENKGIEVQAFTSFEEAMLWLSEEPAEPAAQTSP